VTADAASKQHDNNGAIFLLSALPFHWGVSLLATNAACWIEEQRRLNHSVQNFNQENSELYEAHKALEGQQSE
jgi:hypothetical protein